MGSMPGMPLDLQGVLFCIFKGEQTKMAGPMAKLIPWFAAEEYIISGTVL